MPIVADDAISIRKVNRADTKAEIVASLEGRTITGEIHIYMLDRPDGKQDVKMFAGRMERRKVLEMLSECRQALMDTCGFTEADLPPLKI